MRPDIFLRRKRCAFPSAHSEDICILRMMISGGTSWSTLAALLQWISASICRALRFWLSEVRRNTCNLSADKAALTVIQRLALWCSGKRMLLLVAHARADWQAKSRVTVAAGSKSAKLARVCLRHDARGTSSGCVDSCGAAWTQREGH